MMPVDTIGRELIELVQIDQDFCNNTYGESPCTAQVYQFDFNGDGYIETNNRVLSGDFSIKFSVKIDSSSTSDLKLLDSSNATDRLDVNYSGSGQSINPRDYFTAYVDGIQTNLLPKDDEFHTVELLRDSSNPDQSMRQVGRIGARYTNTLNLEGSIRDVTIYSEGELVLDMPISDNSNTIKDYAGVDDGVLTTGTGSWSGTNQQKCLHTYVTCQDQPNYDKGTKQITFKNNQSGDVDEYTIPILNGFSVTLPELNIFSRDTKNQALGKFGKCSVTFSDTIFSDNHLDPYVSERNYNPLEQGTFWTKFLARNPYYEGWKIRLYDGLVGQALDDMNVREYELEKISNPDTNGNVKIKATDLMRRLDGKKAIFPPASDCQLSRPLNNNPFELYFYTSNKLEDYIITSGWAYARINNEFIRITLTPTDVGGGEYRYDIVDRQHNPSEHATGDGVTNSYRPFIGLINQIFDLVNIFEDLLRPIFSESEFDYTLMYNEIVDNLDYGGFGILSHIKEPTAVSQILGSLLKSVGAYIWYDDVDNITKFKVIRDEDSPVIELDQNNNLVAGKTKTNVISEERFTDAYIYYNLDVSQFLTNDQKVYVRNLLQIDSQATSENEYGKIETYEFKSDWLRLPSDASDYAERLLTQFRSQTREITFELDIKDDIRMAQVFKLAWRGYTDIYGNDEVINWICTGRTRTRDRLKITAQEFKFNVPEA